jgi:hypothetical protein
MRISEITHRKADGPKIIDLYYNAKAVIRGRERSGGGWEDTFSLNAASITQEKATGW